MQLPGRLDTNPDQRADVLSMMQVMMMNDGSNPRGLSDPDDLGMHMWPPSQCQERVTPSFRNDVINMWNEWATKGYFEPTRRWCSWSSRADRALSRSTFTLKDVWLTGSSHSLPMQAIDTLPDQVLGNEAVVFSTASGDTHYSHPLTVGSTISSGTIRDYTSDPVALTCWLSLGASIHASSF